MRNNKTRKTGYMVAEVQPRANTTVLFSLLYVLSFVLFLFGESLQPNGREERERERDKIIRGAQQWLYWS
jgi:hypothetical protein